MADKPMSEKPLQESLRAGRWRWQLVAAVVVLAVAAALSVGVPMYVAPPVTRMSWTVGAIAMLLGGVAAGGLAMAALHTVRAQGVGVTARLNEVCSQLARESDQRRQTEELLRMSQQMLHGVLDQTCQLMGRLALDGTLLSVNRAGLELDNVKEEDVLNRPIWETEWLQRSPETQKQVRQAIELAAQGEFLRQEVVHQDVDGAIRWIDFSLKPVRDNDGNPMFLIAEGYDVTDRKRAEQHQAELLRRLEGVNRLQEDLLLPAPIEQKLQKITETAVRLLDLDFCRIWMIRPGDLCTSGCIHATAVEERHKCHFPEKCLHLLASAGRYAHLDGGHRRVPFDAYKIGRIASGADAKFLTNHVTTDPRVHDHQWAKELGLVSFAGYKLRGAAGEPVGVLAAFAQHPLSGEDDALLASLAETTSRFIIEHKANEALRESERRHRLFAENVSDVIWTMDFTGRFTYVSPSVREMHGYSPEEILHRKFKEFMTPESFTVCQATLKDLISLARRGLPAPSSTLEVEFVRKDGSRLWGEVRYSGMYDESGRLVAVQGITRDLSARKQMEDALREAKQAAETANVAKSRFLANMSHEIRTPMTAILGYADLLTDPNTTPENRNLYAATIRRSGEHLLLIINDILDLSRIEAGKMALDVGRCNIVALLAEVASMVRPRATQRDISFTVEYPGEMPETILTDGARLRQAIVNLTGNAVKFTERGSVRVVAWLRRDFHGDQAAVTFEVIDTGIGIPEDVLPTLFQPFVQGDVSVATKFGGTGLGLAISHQIAQLLGGELTVKSTLGEGSTFTLTVPAGDLEGVRILQNPTEADHQTVDHRWYATMEDLTGVRILLAEDGYDNRELVRTVLHKTGADVAIAENGRIAVKKAEEEPFDLILMDMNMPEMDGYQATRLLRQRGYDRPILALTANAMSGDCERCLEAGCDEFLAKPIDRVALIRTIAGSLGKRPSADATTTASLVSEFIDDAEMTEILEGFVRRLDVHLDAMQKAVSDVDHEELRSLAHKLKGAGGSYGYPSLTEACRQLEEAAKARDGESEQASLEQVSLLIHAIQHGYNASAPAKEDA